MNQAQRKYFIKRLNDIAHQQRVVLGNEYDKKYAAFIGQNQRTLAYVKKHKRQVSEQLYAMALRLLESEEYNKSIVLDSATSSHAPQFVADCYKEAEEERKQTQKEQFSRLELLDRKVEELMDKFYFSEMPSACEELLKELKEFAV